MIMILDGVMYQRKQIQDLMSKMKPEEVPECWLLKLKLNLGLTPADIANHLIDELLDEEIDEEIS